MRTIDGDKLRQEILDELPQGSARGVFLAFVDDTPTVDIVGEILKKLPLNHHFTSFDINFLDRPTI